MYILYDITWIIFFAPSFLIVYFLYEKIISIKFLSFLKIENYIMNFLNGTFLGLFAIVIEILFKNFNFNFQIPIFFVMGLLILMAKNENVSIISSTISFIYYLFQKNNNSIFWYLFILFFLLQFIYTFSSHFFTKKIAIRNLFTFLGFATLIGYFIISYLFNKGFSQLTFENSLFLFFSIFLIYKILFFFIKSTISANILFESNNYIFSKYIRYSLSGKVIGNYIAKNKIKYGVYGLFQYEVENKEELKNNEIRDSILTIFENKIDPKSILFSYQKNIFGFFIPKDNIEDLENKIVIKEIENYLLNIDKTYQTNDNKKYIVKSHSAISLYGKQENSINNLDFNCIFELNSIEKNKVSIYDYKKFQKTINELELMDLMDEKINLNFFSNKKQEIYEFQTLKKTSNFIYTKYNNEEVIHDFFENIIRVNKWKILFNKFFVTEAINKYDFSNEIYYLEYSPFVLEEKFDIDLFKLKLEKRKIKINNIIWYFSYEDIIKNNKMDFIEKIISKNFNIALTNYEKAKIQNINKIKPKALINIDNNKIPTKFLKYKIIYTQINDYKNYDTLDKKRNFEIGGSLLDDKYIFKNIKKTK